MTPAPDAPAWHEDDGFWEAVEPALFTPERIAAAAAEVEAACRLLALTPGARVLDLGTGAGRHAIELARRGFRVTGVDRTERYLGRARVAAAAAGVAVELVAEDMRRFARPQAFDAALNLFTSFGYFDDAGDDLSVARNLCESLVPGGAALFELMGKEVLAGIFRERDWHELVDGFLLEERRVSEGWSGLDLRWVVVRAGTARELRLRHRLYSGAELRALLREAGFASVDLYGSLAGGPYDRSATRLVAVARAD